eukprot:Sspe_Gene.26526::Locus_11041_Transcript_1_1_Confidence_1.000_Length_2972::g.26526::m.26526
MTSPELSPSQVQTVLQRPTSDPFLTSDDETNATTTPPLLSPARKPENDHVAPSEQLPEEEDEVFVNMVPRGPVKHPSLSRFCGCCVRPRFWDKAELGIRCAVAAVLGSVVVQYTGMRDVSPVAVLLPVIAVISAQQTIGGAIAFFMIIVKAASVTTVIGTIWVAAVPRDTHSAVFWVGFSLLNLVFAAVCQNNSIQKFILAFNVVAMVMWYEEGIKITFPILLHATVSIAAGCAVIAAVLPFPRTGMKVARQYLENTCDVLARTFADILAIVSDNNHAARVRVEVTVEHLRTVLLPLIEERLVDAEWESMALEGTASFVSVLFVVPLFFRRKQLGSAGRLRHQYKLVEALVHTLASLQQTLEGLEAKGENHAEFVKYLRGRLITLSGETEVCLLQVPTDKPRCTTRLKQALSTLDHSYNELRTSLFYRRKAAPVPNHILHVNSFLFLVRDFVCRVINHPLSEDNPEATPLRTVFCYPVEWCVDTFKWAVNSQPAWVEGAKTSAALSLATILSIVAQLEPAFWSPITVAFLTTPNTSGGFMTALNRLHGTVVGAVFGYLVIMTVGNEDPWLTILFAAWSALSGLVRGSELYSYSGKVMSLTAAVLLFGYRPGKDIRTMSLSRIEQTVLAALIYVLLIYIVAPVRPSYLIRKELRSSLAIMREHIPRAFSILRAHDEGEEGGREERELVLEDKGRSILTLAASQAKLLKEVLQEPDMWRPSFPTSEFEDVVVHQSRFATSLWDICITLGSLSTDQQMEESKKVVLKHMKPLQEHLDSLLVHLVGMTYQNTEIRGDLVQLCTAKLSRSHEELVDAWHSELLEHRKHSSQPLLSNHDLSAIFCFLLSLRLLRHSVIDLAGAIKAFRMKEAALQLY